VPIPLTQARALVADLGSAQISTLFAQAHARHVLHEVDEAAENFPAFDIDLNDKVTVAAYALLAAGCSIIEQAERQEGTAAVERAASLIHYAHGPSATQSKESSFHVLVAGMAFYAAGQYSRAFVTIRAIEAQTPATRVIAAFLRKDIAQLVKELNAVLLHAPVLDDKLKLDEWAITVAISRAVAISLEFVHTGSDGALAELKRQLADAAIVAKTGAHPAWWWITRLLHLMMVDLHGASPWNILPPYFEPGSEDLARYVRLLAFARHPVTELWSSQRAALPLALDQENRGAVINLRTSAGKTRVAELAILQTLLADPTARIFYLAPFRSLALEVEHTLSATFTWLGYGVSHLYGGSRVSAVDTELAAEATITIATPEKARALFRAGPELFANVKLVIIDEGHLIGKPDRFVRNELFVDHIRALARTTGARLLLLSAVLPNPQELAEWITGDKGAVAISQWKPSGERFGFLRWNGSRVRIDWQGQVASFNPSFVEAKPLGFSRRRDPFPNDKSEAVAATAVRLSAIGPVMIFTARAISVPTLAKAVLLALGENPTAHPWPNHEWKVFEAVCQEELEPDALELRAARAGVVCHSNRLTTQVRLAVEHLMRAKPPRVIVATTTLAQGVNVGISSVIVASPYISQETIGKRDFWNICGRAGRAFVDGEGKILYAIDDNRKRWQIQKDEALARGYFDASTGDRVESGVLFVVQELRRFAAQAGVSFDLLLEIAANNDFSSLGIGAKAAEEICDLVDDELLALHADSLANARGDESVKWVEDVFRDSLAVLQARAVGAETSPDDVIAFLKARVDSVLARVPASIRKAVVSSGLPLSIALKARDHLDTFRSIADAFIDAQPDSAALAIAVREIEAWVRVHAISVVRDMPSAANLDAIRDTWLAGVGLKGLRESLAKATAATTELYGYQLPWIVHAASQQLRASFEEARADALATIALLVELGVPTDLAARIFLAGVRSRSAATELSALKVELGLGIRDIARTLRTADVVKQLRPLVKETTAQWLDLMVEDWSRQRPAPPPDIQAFAMEGLDGPELLHVRRLGDRIFLTTVDGRRRVAVKSTEELPFAAVANDPRVAFAHSNGAWRMVVRDPRIERTEG
jgi:DEAD/DEAH box helicase